jgi:hypothetical protein
LLNHVDKLIPEFSGTFYAVRCVTYQQYWDSQIDLFCIFSLCNEVWSNF